MPSDFELLDSTGLGERDDPEMTCKHCGEVAEVSDDRDLFFDGQGADSGCRECGFPGSVVCDGENEPHWITSDSSTATCDRDVCNLCGWKG